MHGLALHSRLHTHKIKDLLCCESWLLQVRAVPAGIDPGQRALWKCILELLSIRGLQDFIIATPEHQRVLLYLRMKILCSL